MTKLSLPNATAPLVEQQTGRIEKTWYSFLERVSKQLFGNEEGLSEQAAAFKTEFGAWVIEFPDDKTYRLIINAPYGFTITSVTTVSDTGTCTATVEINGTPLGGTANSVSSTEQEQPHSSDNVVAVGDTVSVVITSNSGCEGMTLVITGTRTLS